MLRHHLLFALRGLRRRPLAATVNVFGLAVGLAGCLLIALYVYHAWSFDRFHDRSEDVFRVIQEHRLNGTQRLAVTPATLSPDLQATFPEIAAATRTARSVATVRSAGTAFPEQTFILAEPGFLDVFSFPVARGEGASALAAPNTALLTTTTAQRYFGEADPIGEPLVLRVRGAEETFTVRGLLKDVPAATHLRFDGLLSFATREAALSDQQRRASMFWTYVRLHPTADAAALEERFPAFIADRLGPEAPQALAYDLEPLLDIHLHSDVLYGLGGEGDATTIAVLALVAALLLLIAVINYINLSTARAHERAHEVGIRKAVGAVRPELVSQFLAEAVVLAALGVGLAVFLSALALPPLERWLGSPLHTSLPPVPWLIFGAGLLALLVGLLAGLYPALVLSRYRPAHTLKGAAPSGRTGLSLRHGLVIVQFAATIVLLSATLVMLDQLTYVQERELGLTVTDVVNLRLPDGANADQVAQAWTSIPGVLEATASSFTGLGTPARGLVGRPGATEPVQVNWYDVAATFTDFFQVPTVAGRTLEAAMSTDSVDAVLLNEAASRALGWARPDEAIGAVLSGVGGRVVGVVADYHFASLHQNVEPLVLRWRPDRMSVMHLRIAAADRAATLARLEAAWREVSPEPFAYTFLEDVRRDLYAQEAQLSQLLALFAVLAVVVSCLGLFGLASFTVARRRKEVVIRKVLGASVTQVFALLTRQYLGLIVLAHVVALPFAVLGVRRWLEGFAYRIALPYSTFLLVAGLLLAITLATVAYQSLLTARTNPADALRRDA